MRLSYVLMLVVLATSTQAEIHTWVDEHGKKHFSDKLPDHLKHKTATVDYSSSIPTEAEREEANRIYQQSKKHADGIPKARSVRKQDSSEKQSNAKKKHLTRNDKFRIRREEEARAKELCKKFNQSQRDCITSMTGYCEDMKRPPNCV